MSTTAPNVSKRWAAFQCPSCFGLFRTQRANLGRQGKCPVCQTIVALPEQAGGDAGTVVRKGTQSFELKKVAVATPMTEEELAEVAAKKAANRERRRVYSGSNRDSLAWEKGDGKSSRSKGGGYFIGVAAMIVVLAGVGGVYYIQNAPKDKVVEGSLVVGDAASSRALEEALKSTEAKQEIDEDVIESVSAYDKFDLQAIEKRVEGFLTSETVEERLKFVRDPERVKPLMLDFYEGESIEAEGFRSLNRQRVSVADGGEMLTLPAQTGDFLSGLIDVFRVGEGEEADYLIDWEAWVGYCEKTPEEASESKPTEPFLMRVNLRPNNYYNFGFSDDTKWRGFRMTFRNYEEVYLAYSQIDSEADLALKKVLGPRGVGESSFVVKVRFPPGARARDQVEIVEVVAHGWITNLDEK